ncbi:MAG: hypothetical protein WCL39_06720 [Armatimonadota bacterium]
MAPQTSLAAVVGLRHGEKGFARLTTVQTFLISMPDATYSDWISNESAA